eukprot:g7733.t1
MDGEASVWTSLEPSSSVPDSKPAGRCGHVAISSRHGQSLIVIGGYNPEGILTDAWEFHLGRREWDRISLAAGPSPPERAFFRGCGGPPPMGAEQPQQHGEEGEGVFAYVFGGSDADGNASNELWCLDVGNRTWHEVLREQGPQPYARSNHAMCRAGQYLAVHGGESGTGSLLDDLWFFHPATAAWREAGNDISSSRAAEGPRPCCRSSHCLAFAQDCSAEGSAGLPGSLVLFGGLGRADGGGGGGGGVDDGEEQETMPLNDLWVFRPAASGSGGLDPACFGGDWSLVMLDGVGPSPRSLAAIVSPKLPSGADGGGSDGADLFLFGGYGLVEIPTSSGGMVGYDEGGEVEIIMAYIDDLWRLSRGRDGDWGCSGGGGAHGASQRGTSDVEWANEADMGFPGESIVEGRNGHTLTWCGDKLVLFGGFVGDGFDAGVHVAEPPSSSLALD